MFHELSVKLKDIYYYIPIIVILCPTFPSLLPELLGFQLIFILEIVFVITCGILGIYQPKHKCVTTTIILFFLSATIVSISFDLINGVTIISDYFELVKPFAFILFFWFYRYSVISSDELISYTFKALLVIYCFLTVFTLIAFLFPESFRSIEFMLYKRSSVPILANKAIGSFSTTYHYAFFLILPLSYTFILLLRSPGLKHLLMFFLVLTSMVLTQSRSMYLCSVLCIILSYFCPILHETKKQKLITITIIGIVLTIGVCIFFQYQEELYKNLTYAFEGLSAMSEGGNNSVNVRENQIRWAFENNTFLLIGAGIGKGEIMLESFYSLYLYRYGLIGMIISLSLFIVTSYKSIIIARTYTSDNRKIGFFALAVFYFIVPFSITSSCHMDSPKISFLFYGLIGLIFRKYHEIQELKYKQA